MRCTDRLVEQWTELREVWQDDTAERFLETFLEKIVLNSDDADAIVDELERALSEYPR